MLLKSAVLVCLLAELGLARQKKRQAEPEPVFTSISILPRPSLTGTGSASSAAPTGIYLNTSIPAVPSVTTLTEVATVTATDSNNVTMTDVVTTERTVTADPVTLIRQPKIIIISQQTFFNFISGLGGAPPSVQPGEQGGFKVGGLQFGQFQSACSAACNMQFTQCQSFAGQNFTVTQCQTQLIACQNAAKTATVTVSVPTTVTQTIVVPDMPATGDSNVPTGIADGGSIITTTTLPPGAGATVGTGGVSFVTGVPTPGAPPAQTPAVPETSALTTTIENETGFVVSTAYVTRIPTSGDPEASRVVSSADAVASSAVATSAVVTTIQDETGGARVSTVYGTRSAEVPAASQSEAVGGSASEAVGSLTTSAVETTLTDATGGNIVSTIYVTRTTDVPAASQSEAVSGPASEAIGSLATSAVVTTLPASSPGGEQIVSTIYVTRSAEVPAASQSDAVGGSASGAVGSLITSALITTLPPSSPGGEQIVSTIYVTKAVDGAVSESAVASASVSQPSQSSDQHVTSVITMTVPASGSAPPRVSVVTITIEPTAIGTATAPAKTDAVTSAIESTLPAETPGGFNRVTTIYVTAPPPAPTVQPSVSLITVTLSDLTGVITISPSQTSAVATTIQSALSGAGAGVGGGGGGSSVGDKGSCPSASTVTVTRSFCPSAVTRILTQTVSVVPTQSAAAAAKRAAEKRDEQQLQAAQHQRRHGRAFGFW